MEVVELKSGLWRWTVPHPEWKPEKGGPGGWEQMVGCLYYEPADGSGDITVLIDPQVPPPGSQEETRFWEALDKDVNRRGFPVTILLGNHYHERSAQIVHDRYERSVGASLWARDTARRRVRCRLTDTFHEQTDLP
ncbi:MAG: hypothetical protein L0191_11700, partial [Acidobacteria bacterium]|nr:hypothetical protein [Acidobacteriota bacterium]